MTAITKCPGRQKAEQVKQHENEETEAKQQRGRVHDLLAH
jgi:hypothetical protein